MNSEQIAKSLLMCNAVKVSIDPPFTWTSGIKSPIYCDNRKMTAYPEERALIVKSLVKLISQKYPDVEVIAGTATAAISWAAMVAYEMNLPMIYIRPEPKKHGAKKQIEGELFAAQKVVLVEDLISTGGSSIKAAKVIEEEGQSSLMGIVAIVSYELELAKNNFAEAKYAVDYLTEFSTIIDLVEAYKSISPEQKKVVLDFKNDPQTWATKNNL
jgi:orotate phosphoribosyltransferase